MLWHLSTHQNPLLLSDAPSVMSSQNDMQHSRLSFLYRQLTISCSIGLQNRDWQKLRHPIQINGFIKEQKQTATQRLHSQRPQAALSGFLATMDALLSSAANRMDRINFVTVGIATAQLWLTAHQNGNLVADDGLRSKLESQQQRCLHILQPVLADMRARKISNVLWSSAKLGLKPDDFPPGMVHTLTSR